MQGATPHPVVVLVSSGGATVEYRSLRLPRKSTILLGVSEIIMGLALIAINSAAIAIGDDSGGVAHGIWGGILFIITGAFSVAAARGNNPCLVVTTWVLSIGSVLLSPAFVYLSIRRLLLFSYGKDDGIVIAKKTLNSALIALSLMEGVAMIATLFLSSKSACCRKAPDETIQPILTCCRPFMSIAKTQMAPQPVSLELGSRVPILVQDKDGQLYAVRASPIGLEAPPGDQNDDYSPPYSGRLIQK